MLRSLSVAVGMWAVSSAMSVVHYKYCVPWWIAVEPCMSLQRSSLFLNGSIQNYGLMMIAVALEMTMKYMPKSREDVSESKPSTA